MIFDKLSCKQGDLNKELIQYSGYYGVHYKDSIFNVIGSGGLYPLIYNKGHLNQQFSVVINYLRK